MSCVRFAGVVGALVVAFAWPRVAGATPVEVDARTDELPLWSRLELLEDPSGKLGVDDLRGAAARRFTPWTGRFAPNLGFTKSVVWVRFELHNATAAPLTKWLELDQSTVDDVRLFLPGEVRPPQGRVHPVGAMELRRRTYAFHIDLPAGASVPVLLRFESQNEMQVPLTLWELSALVAHDARRGLALTLILGVIVAMALYNLLLFAFVRDRSYLIYSVYASAFATWLALLDGSIAVLLPATMVLPRWPFLLSVIVGIICALLFVRRMFDVPATHPRINRAIQLWVAWCAVWPVIALTVVDWRTQNITAVAFLPVTFLGTVGVSLLRWREGVSTARWVFFGWLALAALMVPAVLAAQGLLPFQGPGLLIHLGFMCEAIFLSIALADAARQRNLQIAQLHAAGRRFVPFEFLALLGRKALPDVRAGDRIEREMTVFFSDIRGFTSTVEGLTPEETMNFVNDYLREMEPQIRAQGGFVDKYIGDAVMALFERPADAVRAALGCLAALDRINAKSTRPIHVGVGLHTGPLILGTVGSPERLSCTVLGDSVNLASRVEGLTRTYGARLLVTGSTATTLSTFSLRALDRVAVKGKSQPIDVLEVLDALPPEARTRRERTREAFDAARGAYARGDLVTALAAFDRAVVEDPDDAPAGRLAMRCRTLLHDGLPTGWDGVQRMETK